MKRYPNYTDVIKEASKIDCYHKLSIHQTEEVPKKKKTPIYSDLDRLEIEEAKKTIHWFKK